MLGSRSADVGHVLENIVYLELMRRGYDVCIGKVDEYEVDFVAMKGRDVKYFQVAASVRDGLTLERDLRPLVKIGDNYPKAILTLDDDPACDYDGVKRLKSVILPNSIEVIGSLAFGRCTGMTSFNCGNGVRIIEHCAFGTAQSMSKFVFSERTEFIGWECFHHASALTTLNIPKSIKKIDYSIMNGVLFETVNFAGSEDEWKKVDVNSNNSELLGATYNYNVKF